MRLPSSTIVMSLIACVPFGLAIRETLAQPEPPATDDNSLAQAGIRAPDPERETASARAEAAQAAQTEAAVRQVFGAEVATFGPVLDGIVIGASSQSFQPEAARQRIQAFDRDHSIAVEFDFDSTELHAVTIVPRADASCAALERALRIAWGPGDELEMTSGTRWLNQATRLRAVLEHTDTCRLRFERYATVDTWINQTHASIVPLWAIGQPVARLTETLTGIVSVDDQLVEWSGLPLDAGLHTTQLSARVARGKVVGVTAEIETDGATSVDLERSLSDAFGAPKRASDGRLYWAKPTLILDTTSTTVVVTAGHP